MTFKLTDIWERPPAISRSGDSPHKIKKYTFSFTIPRDVYTKTVEPLSIFRLSYHNQIARWCYRKYFSDIKKMYQPAIIIKQ